MLSAAPASRNCILLLSCLTSEPALPQSLSTVCTKRYIRDTYECRPATDAQLAGSDLQEFVKLAHDLADAAGQITTQVSRAMPFALHSSPSFTSAKETGDTDGKGCCTACCEHLSQECCSNHEVTRVHHCAAGRVAAGYNEWHKIICLQQAQPQRHLQQQLWF